MKQKYHLSTSNSFQVDTGILYRKTGEWVVRLKEPEQRYLYNEKNIFLDLYQFKVH